ncbi:MAG: hypothetical protein Q9184_007790 [Pyrenodesmia sp. 2 TL-2023]
MLDDEESLPLPCNPATCAEASPQYKESPDPGCNSAALKNDSPANVNEKDDNPVLQQKGRSYIFNPLPLTEAPKEVQSNLSSSSIDMVMVKGTGYVIRPLPLTQASKPKVPTSTPLSTEAVMPGRKGYITRPLQLTQAPKPRVWLSRYSSTETVVKIGTGPKSSFLPLTHSPPAESRASSTPEVYNTPPPASNVPLISLTLPNTSVPDEVMLDGESLAASLPRQPRSKREDMEVGSHVSDDGDESDS